MSLPPPIPTATPVGIRDVVHGFFPAAVDQQDYKDPHENRLDQQHSLVAFAIDDGTGITETTGSCFGGCVSKGPSSRNLYLSSAFEVAVE
jgi:hypothetical protein